MHILKLNFTHANATENHFGSESQGTSIGPNTKHMLVVDQVCPLFVGYIHDVAAHFSMRN